MTVSYGECTGYLGTDPNPIAWNSHASTTCPILVFSSARLHPLFWRIRPSPVVRKNLQHHNIITSSDSRLRGCSETCSQCALARIPTGPLAVVRPRRASYLRAFAMCAMRVVKIWRGSICRRYVGQNIIAHWLRVDGVEMGVKHSVDIMSMVIRQQIPERLILPTAELR